MHPGKLAAAFCWLAFLGLAGCAASVATPASVAPATAAVIPGASPTLVQEAACASAPVAAMANAVATAPPGSSVETDAVTALVSALAAYAGAAQAGNPCAQ